MTFHSLTHAKPRVSVVMANYNGAAHVGDAIQSVLAQSLGDLELIVVDDASIDASLSIITQFAATDARVQPIFLAENVGPGGARNRGLEVARGQWVAVADSDDLFHRTRLQSLIESAEANGCSAIADDLIFFADASGGEAQHLFQNAKLDGPTDIDFDGLLADDFAGGPNHLGYTKPVFRRSCLGSLRYRSDLRIGEDFDLLLRFAAKGQVLTIVPEAFYLYRRHANSISHRLSGANAAAMLEAMEDLRREAPPHHGEALDQRIQAMRKTAEEMALIEDAKSIRSVSVLNRLLRKPSLAGALVKACTQKLQSRSQDPQTDRARDLVLTTEAPDQSSIPQSWDVAVLHDFDGMSARDRAELTAMTMDPLCTIHAGADVGDDHLGLIPDSARVIRYPAPIEPLVHVRTTAYRRPDALRRALESLQAQTIDDWVCDVYDDDPDASGEAVVRELDDPRIRYTANSPQRFASANIDRCFTRFNPHGATYFCVLEDDNQLLPTYFEENILLCELKGVNIVLRNQLVERDSGTERASLSAEGLLEEKFDEGYCDPETLHLSVMADWGVSNGGLFWSRQAVSDLEIGVPCSAAFQEYLRTMAIVEPIYVALKPLAIWAENGESTARDLGASVGWLRRELGLKRSAQALRRYVWARSSASNRDKFRDGGLLRYSNEMRADGLIKALLFRKTGKLLPLRRRLRLLLRGLVIRAAGKPMPGLDGFLESRGVSPSGRV